MNEYLVKGTTLPEAYHNAILYLCTSGEELTCNDWSQNQKEVSMTIVIEKPLQDNMISKLYIGGYYELQKYVMEMVNGIYDFKIDSNSKDGLHYTYHDRLVNLHGFNQLDFIINELKRQKDTRRAVAILRDNEIDSRKDSDPACLQHLQYFIRNDKLHCKAIMRSNDAVKATFMNIFAFIMLQKYILSELLKTYPDLEMGSFTLRANSFHCYSTDYDKLNQYTKAILEQHIDDITYSYYDFYKEEMDNSIDRINREIEVLKGEREFIDE